MTIAKNLLRLFTACTLGLYFSAALGQAWPNKPIKFIVPFSPGGANDLMARAAAEGAAKHLGQTIVVENKPGAGGNLGSTFVAKSAPDGYTFLISAAGVISNSMIKKSNPYKDSDLTPVAMIGLAPSVIVVAANSSYKNLKDFVEASKTGQGFHFATAGTGSTPHFVAELLNTHYGAKLIPVPYKSGSEGATAVMGGQVEATSEASIVALPHIKTGGKFRPLATTWIKRISVFPELSTASEQGFSELQIAHWAGVHAPAGVPSEILDKLAEAVDAAMKSPAITDRLKAMGIEPMGGTRPFFSNFVDAERTRLALIVKASGMKED
ncbi:MAG: tripartite tricarboxylate transporter substrate binding protein [Burkholderiaceae bacterium]